MSTNNDTIKLKLAWQTAFELRTCPDSDTLHAPKPDEHLKKHLAICHVCREKRDMNINEQNAWKIMKGKFAAIAMKPGTGTEKHAGQVWTIKKEFGGWRADGRFTKPPSVVLLEKVDGTSGWRVAQLYNDKRMMGAGDVALDDCYGFAEAWNCYSLKDDRLEKCLGGIPSKQLQQVVSASITSCEPAAEGSILSFFRNMEIEVGAFVGVPAAMELVEEWENAQEQVIELVPGLKLAIDAAKGFVLDIAADTLDLLRGTFRPAFVLRGAAIKPTLPKLSDEQKKLIQEHCPVVPVEVKIVEDTLSVRLKWMPEKPSQIPSVCVILNGIKLDNIESNDTSKDMTTFIFKHRLLARINMRLLKKLQFKVDTDQIVFEIEI